MHTLSNTSPFLDAPTAKVS